MSQSHQLAAIMFTDIVGYTKLMDEDEQKAFNLLIRNREVQKPIIENYNGKWLKEMGDGVLATFNSVSDAVYCAKEIQEACLNDPDLNLRIGIHQGDVVFEENDVFGSGVNIASRLEHLAPIGGILVSEFVYKDLINKKGIEGVLIGEMDLKGVRAPIKVYQVKVEGVAIAPFVTQTVHTSPSGIENPEQKSLWQNKFTWGVIVVLLLAIAYYFYTRPFNNEYGTVSEIEFEEKSIAVLPFVSLSTDPEKQYLADGMMDAILLHLSKIENLRVITRTSVERYRSTTKTIPEIAAELNVHQILEGSFQKQGDRANLIVQLSNAQEDEDHLWAKEYNRNWSDIFAVQSEVAQAIAAELKAVISTDQKRQIESVPTKSQAAYESYLMGRYFWNKRTKEGLKKCVDYFEQALENDPEYSLAYAGLGDAYLIQVPYGLLDQNKGFPKAKKYALKALEMNPNLAEAHATLGTLARREWRWQEAERELKRAIELNPNYSWARHWYIEYLIAVRQPEEARKQMNRALEIDPLSFKLHQQNISLYYNEGKLDKALKEIQKTQELNPNQNQSGMLFKIYKELGRNQEALKLLQEYFSTSDIQMNIDRSEDIYAKEGIDGVIRWWIAIEVKEFNKILKPKAGHYMFFAEYFAILGEKELAFGYLERGIKLRPDYGPYINSNRVYKNLRSDPRFKALLKEMGLEE